MCHAFKYLTDFNELKLNLLITKLYVLRKLQFFIFVFQIFCNSVVYILCSALQRMTRNTVALYVISYLSLPGYELTQYYLSDNDPWH